MSMCPRQGIVQLGGHDKQRSEIKKEDRRTEVQKLASNMKRKKNQRQEETGVTETCKRKGKIAKQPKEK